MPALGPSSGRYRVCITSKLVRKSQKLSSERQKKTINIHKVCTCHQNKTVWWWWWSLLLFYQWHPAINNAFNCSCLFITVRVQMSYMISFSDQQQLEKTTEMFQPKNYTLHLLGYIVALHLHPLSPSICIKTHYTNHVLKCACVFMLIEQITWLVCCVLLLTRNVLN